jgi:hypothetical protein
MLFWFWFIQVRLGSKSNKKRSDATRFSQRPGKGKKKQKFHMAAKTYFLQASAFHHLIKF